MVNIEIAFKKKIPSIFIVASPLQALCAIATIRNLEITDYKIYVLIFHGIRDEQTKMVVETFGMHYELVDKRREIYPIAKRLKSLQHSNGYYRRAFVGSYVNVLFYFFALRKIANNGVVVTLDDGNITIPILKEEYKYKNKSMFSLLNHLLLRVVSSIKKIRVKSDYYTIYEGFCPKQISIQYNDISFLFSSKCSQIKKNVFFAGTNANAYTKELNISYDSYYNFVSNVLKMLVKQYPDDQIIYIPHGNFDDTKIRNFCIMNNIVFDRPDKCIELYIGDLDYCPKALYGLTSSCLYTIRKLFPMIEVKNVLFGYNNDYINISDYYQKNGIEKLILV